MTSSFVQKDVSAFSSNISVTALYEQSSEAGLFYGENITIPEGCLVAQQHTKPGSFLPWANPHNIISAETEMFVNAVVGGVCLPILFLISVPCNVLNMLVFYTQGLGEPINLCLFALSLVDLLHMVNNLLFNVDKLYLPFAQAGGPVFRFIVDHNLVGFRPGLNFLSGFISMLIACKRCLCVVKPLRSQTIMKTQTTAIILGTGFVLIPASAVFIGVRWSLACMFDPETNSTSQVVSTSQFYLRHKAHMDVLVMLLVTIQPLIYVSVVTATTIVTSVKLKKMVTWREQASSSAMSSREVALTRTLIAVSILYLVCSVPVIVIGIGTMLVPGMGPGGRYHNFFNLVISMFDLCSYINATFNFLVYCLLGSRYKETLCRVLRCRLQTAEYVNKSQQIVDKHY